MYMRTQYWLSVSLNTINRIGIKKKLKKNMYPLTSFVGFMQQSLLFCLPITWLNIRSSDKLVCYYTQGFDSLWQAFQLLLFCPQLKPHCVHLNLSFPGLIAQRYVCVCVCVWVRARLLWVSSCAPWKSQPERIKVRQPTVLPWGQSSNHTTLPMAFIYESTSGMALCTMSARAELTEGETEEGRSLSEINHPKLSVLY